MTLRTSAIALLALAAAAPAAAAPSCDRACLDGMADKVLAAMAERAPEHLPFARVVRYSENNVSIDIGDGAWATITAHGAAAVRAADPATGQVVWMGEIAEHGQPGFMALRLKVESGRIAEIEAVIRRKGGPPQYGDPEAYRPDPAFAAAPAGREAPKAMVAAVDGWFDAVQGKRGAAKIAAGCERQDNGLASSSGATADGGVQGCAAQIRAGVFKPIETVRARRYLVDAARGVVVAAGFYDLPSATPKPAAAKGFSWAEDFPYSLAFISAFKLKDGGVWRIDTISNAQPYLMPSPWGGK